jgi:hypothetical protein
VGRRFSNILNQTGGTTCDLTGVRELQCPDERLLVMIDSREEAKAEVLFHRESIHPCNRVREMEEDEAKEEGKGHEHEQEKEYGLMGRLTNQS